MAEAQPRQFHVVPSLKFEIFLPATYTDPTDPTGRPQNVQLVEVATILHQATASYGQDGGYTICNPFGPPPYAGGYQGGPEERNFWAMIIVPDPLQNQAAQDMQRLVDLFQQKYHQAEILCYHYHVNRYVPEQPAAPKHSS